MALAPLSTAALTLREALCEKVLALRDTVLDWLCALPPRMALPIHSPRGRSAYSVEGRRGRVVGLNRAMEDTLAPSSSRGSSVGARTCHATLSDDAVRRGRPTSPREERLGLKERVGLEERREGMLLAVLHLRVLANTVNPRVLASVLALSECCLSRDRHRSLVDARRRLSRSGAHSSWGAGTWA